MPKNSHDTEIHFNQSFPAIQKIVQKSMRGERIDHTLGFTGVLSEAYLKLRNAKRFDNTRRFLGAVSHAANQVLVDYARRRNAQKRGVGVEHIDISVVEVGTLDGEARLPVRAALQTLRKERPLFATIIEQQYFFGLTEAEIAGKLNIGQSTVRSYRRKAIARLRELLG